MTRLFQSVEDTMAQKAENIPAWAAIKWKGNKRGLDEFKAFIKDKLLPILGIASQ